MTTNIISKEFNKFIKDIKRNNISLDDAIHKLDENSPIYDFFNTRNTDNTNPNNQYQYKRVIVNEWGYEYIDENSKKSITSAVLFCETINGDLFFIEQYYKHNICNKIIQDQKNDHLKFITRKHPSIYKSFIKKGIDYQNINDLKKIYENIIYIKNTIQGKDKKEIYDFLKNEDLRKKFFFTVCVEAKDRPVSIHDFIEQLDYEELYDFVVHMKEEQKLTSFINKIASRKDRMLFNYKSREYIREIIRLDINVSEFRETFSNKIAKYKTTEDLELGLQKHLKILSGWDKDEWLQNLSNLDIKPTEIKENVLLFEVKDFNTMSKIGSPQWCIATTQSYFDQYNASEYRRQFMVCDFNKDSDDDKSMIGITVDTSGKPLYAHDKNDINILYNKTLLDIKEYIPEYNRDALSEKIVTNINNRYDKNDPSRDTEFSIGVKKFQDLSFYGINSGSNFDEAQKELENFITQLDQEDLDLFQKSRCINNLIQILDKNKNNISECFNVFNNKIDKISKIFNFKHDITIQYLIHERNDSFLNIFLKEYPQNKWNIIRKCLDGETNNDNFKFISSLYNYDQKNFWNEVKEAYDSNYYHGLPFFDDDDVYNFMKDKNIPIDTFINLFQDIVVFNKDDHHIGQNLLKHFEAFNSKDQDDIIIKMLNKSMSNILSVLYLVDNEHISKERCFQSILKSFPNVNKDTYHAFTETNRRNISPDLIFSTLELLVNNTDNINNHIECRPLFSNTKVRNLLLDKDLINHDHYMQWALKNSIVERKGVPIIMKAFNDSLKNGENLFNRRWNIKQITEDLFELSVSKEVFSEKEFEGLLKKNMPLFDIKNLCFSEEYLKSKKTNKANRKL